MRLDSPSVMGCFDIDARSVDWDEPTAAGRVGDTEPRASTNHYLNMGL